MKFKVNNNINYARQCYYEFTTLKQMEFVALAGIHGVNHPFNVRLWIAISI